METRSKTKKKQKTSEPVNIIYPILEPEEYYYDDACEGGKARETQIQHNFKEFVNSHILEEDRQYIHTMDDLIHYVSKNRK